MDFLFFDLALTVFILALVLTVLAVFYAKLLTRFNKLSVEQDNVKAGMQKKAQSLLDEAQIRASKIIENAQTKGLELINSSSFYNEESKHVFEDQLKAARENQYSEFSQTSKEFLESYEKAVENLKQEDIKKLYRISEDIETSASSQVQDFTKIIEEETIRAQKIVEEKIEKEYQQVRTELDQYKKDQYAKLDEEMYKIIKKVSEKVLSKGISLDDSEQLVVNALEEAKKEIITR